MDLEKGLPTVGTKCMAKNRVVDREKSLVKTR
jgi:hypothetical protein